eukprot:g16008.t1
MAPTSPAVARRATSFALTVALAVCSCGGVAQGFVVPSAASTVASPARSRAGAKSHGADVAAKAPTAPRQRAPFRLLSSKGPTPSPGGGADIMDNIAGLGRELTTDEKIAALQKEVAAQAALAAETDEVKTEEEAKEGGPDAEMAIPAVEADKEEEEESATGFFSKGEEFETEPGFVDEGKNIKWPNPRRAAQLTLLAVVAQIAFIVYIISLNSLLNNIPGYFQHLVDFIKSGDISQAQLPDLTRGMEEMGRRVVVVASEAVGRRHGGEGEGGGGLVSFAGPDA